VNEAPAPTAQHEITQLEDDFAHLAEAARSCIAAAEYLGTAVRLSRWAAAGRPVTTTGVPRPGDAADAARACGLAVPQRRITRAAQVPGLVEAWDLALDSGLVELVDRGAAAAGPHYDAWPDGADEDVVSVWLTAFVVAVGLDALDDDRPRDIDKSVDGFIVADVLQVLAHSAQTVEDLAAAVQAAAMQDLSGEFAYLRASIGGDPVPRIVELLERWGVVVRSGPTADLTALGRYACRTLELDPGEQVDPTLDAGALLAALESEPERGPGPAGEWIGSRTPRAAADQLLAAAADASPVGRVMAVTLVQGLGAEALPAWKKAAKSKSTGIGPYARTALWEAGVGPEPSPADGAWLAADLAATVQVLGPAADDSFTADTLAAAAVQEMDQDEMAALIALIRKSGHPSADAAVALFELAADTGHLDIPAPLRGGAKNTGAARSAPQDAEVGYQLKITLRGARPPIWRRVIVPDVTLRALHNVIQQAMGWEDCHMYVFETRGARYGRPDRDLGHRDDTKVRVSALLNRPGDTVRYEYDFGDGWEHDIVLEKLVAPVGRATCTAGRRHCPPEDCGGVWGYAELLEALADPAHDQHEELSEWLEDAHGESGYDPEHFDPAEQDRALALVRL
jgi:Plasmid pRiA4b ORF-3-like protein